jgi:retinol dehydrogenase-12
MPDLLDRTFIVTGANTGIGLVTARELARRQATVILACRSAEKTRPVIEALRAETGNPRIEFVALDLGSLASVRRAADELLAGGRPIHVLINNAGLAGSRGQTSDGFELTVGTNHLGPYLLTRLLLDRIAASGDAATPARIVNVASKAHYGALPLRVEAFQQRTASRTGFDEYKASKLCNVLFTAELARRAPSTVRCYAVHPGVVASDVWRQVPAPVRWVMKRFMISVEEGALTQLHCATAPELAGETGKYYDQRRAKPPSAQAQDADLARALWDRSAELVGLPA